MKCVETQTIAANYINVGVDTRDLIVKKPLDLSVEFQYCIGHEPELHPDELPQYQGRP